MSNKDTALAQPIKIGNRIATNRFAINAMECCDGDEHGNMTQHAISRYENLFRGGAGVIVFESITMQYDNRARERQISLQPNNKENIEGLRKFIKEMKEINDKPLLIFQLNQSGEIAGDEFSKRKCVKPLYGFGGELFTEEEIEKAMDEFVLASKILYDIGADGVDLKFCHGYLGTQILRPYNDRKWKYGGSWENRSRFAFEITERVRKEISDKNFLVGSKVTMWEAIPGGQGTAGPDTAVMDFTEPIALCKGLEERGANFILQSIGNSIATTRVLQPTPMHPEDVYLHFTASKALKEALKPETVVIGSAYSVLNDGFNNKLTAIEPEKRSLISYGNYNIEHGITDMIALGRQSLADPYLPKKYLEDKTEDINWCKTCDMCCKLLLGQKETACAVFNEQAKADYLDLIKSGKK